MQYLVQFGKYSTSKVVNAHSAEQAVLDVARTEMRIDEFLHEVKVFALTHDGTFKVNSQIDVKRV